MAKQKTVNFHADIFLMGRDALDRSDLVNGTPTGWSVNYQPRQMKAPEPHETAGERIAAAEPESNRDLTARMATENPSPLPIAMDEKPTYNGAGKSRRWNTNEACHNKPKPIASSNAS